jgi:hypothetical protein
MKFAVLAAVAVTAMGSTASAAISGSLGGPFAGYANLIDLDADFSGSSPGGPISVSSTFYLGSHGVTMTDDNGHAGWTNTGNPGLEGFGITAITWDTDIKDLQIALSGWEGLSPFAADWIDVFNDGAFIGTFSAFGAGGTGSYDFINISATAFDEIRIAWFSTDNVGNTHFLNWNVVPTPPTAALVGLGGLLSMRRRR